MFDHHPLLHDGFKFVVHHEQSIKGPVVVLVNDILPNVQGVFKTETVEDPRPFLPNGPGPAPEKVDAFSSDDADRRFLSGLLMFIEKLEGASENVGVKRPTEPAITRHHKQFRFLPRAFPKKRMGHPV